MVEELEAMLQKGDELPLKRLMLAQVYFNYLPRTYSWMAPYLKGIHLTINEWHPDRDKKGYPLSRKAWKAKLHEMEKNGYRLKGKAWQARIQAIEQAEALPC